MQEIDHMPQSEIGVTLEYIYILTVTRAGLRTAQRRARQTLLTACSQSSAPSNVSSSLIINDDKSGYIFQFCFILVFSFNLKNYYLCDKIFAV